MPKDENRRLSQSIIAADRESLASLKNIEGYAPANPACTLEALTQLEAEMDAAQDEEQRASATLAARRDHTTTIQWKFHNTVTAMKDQVQAQFGRDSAQVQTVGRKRESERKRPTARKKKNGSDK